MEVLGQVPVLGRRRAAEVIPGKTEALAQVLVLGVELAAVLGHRQARLQGGELGRGAVLDRKSVV